jgi:hypothetical protein
MNFDLDEFVDSAACIMEYERQWELMKADRVIGFASRAN